MMSRSWSPTCRGACASGVLGGLEVAAVHTSACGGASLTVGEVDAVFEHLASLSRAGSTAARAAAVNVLLARATAQNRICYAVWCSVSSGRAPWRRRSKKASPLRSMFRSPPYVEQPCCCPRPLLLPPCC